MRHIALFVPLIFLTACQSNETLYAGYDEPSAQVIDAAQQDVAKMRSLFGDTTFITHSEVHGTQVEYHEINGDTWLVYPGNAQVLKGRWSLTDGKREQEICYMYFTRGINPATGVKGTDWECEPTINRFLEPDTIALYGDIFSLTDRGAIPETFEFKKQLTPREIARIFDVPESALTLKLAKDG